jgi:hypothetical protein
MAVSEVRGPSSGANGNWKQNSGISLVDNQAWQKSERLKTETLRPESRKQKTEIDFDISTFQISAFLR